MGQSSRIVRCKEVEMSKTIDKMTSKIVEFAEDVAEGMTDFTRVNTGNITLGLVVVGFFALGNCSRTSSKYAGMHSDEPAPIVRNAEIPHVAVPVKFNGVAVAEKQKVIPNSDSCETCNSFFELCPCWCNNGPNGGCSSMDDVQRSIIYFGRLPPRDYSAPTADYELRNYY